MDTRICNKCGQEKPLDEFFRNRTRPLGRDYWCKKCRTEYDRIRARKSERVARAKQWIQSERGKALRSQRLKKDYAQNKDKYRAKTMVEKLVKMGFIKKSPCSKCGNSSSLGHHPDYSKPLEITWLCQEHHSEEHRNLKAK